MVLIQMCLIFSMVTRMQFVPDKFYRIQATHQLMV